MAKIIDGKMISTQIKDELKEKVAELKKAGTEVSLAVIQVGNNPASTVYVGNKKKACEYVGIKSFAYELPEETTEKELLDVIKDFNYEEETSGDYTYYSIYKPGDEYGSAFDIRVKDGVIVGIEVEYDD